MSDVTPAPPPRTPIQGDVWLYHPRGPKVRLPVHAGYQEPLGFVYDAHEALAAVDQYLDAGWLLDAPGLEAGERKDECGWVLCRDKQGRNGGTVPALDLYLPDDRYSKVRVYLNTPEEQQEFERVSGLKLASIPRYIADNKVERGANANVDRQFVVKAPRPFGFGWKDNPDYNAAETDPKKKKPARLFVRWADGGRPAAGGGEQQPQQQAGADSAAAWWRDFLGSYPPSDVLNKHLPDLREVPDGPVKSQIKNDIHAYATGNGWTLDKQAGRYAEPRPAATADDEIPF